MTKDLFITELRRALASDLSSTEIDVHVQYYNEYFATEMSKGRSENEILAELGEARLIAKSIVGAKIGEERHHEEEERTEYRTERIRRVPAWLMIVVVVLILLAIIILALRVFIGLLPVILIIVAVGMIATFLRRLF